MTENPLEQQEKEMIQEAIEGPKSPSMVLSLEDLKSVLTSALAPITQRLENLENRPQESLYADGIPQSMRRSDPNVDGRHMQTARKVTIATRAAIENPQDYPNIVDGSTIGRRG